MKNILFDEFVLSYKVGMTKHDSEIFELAAERLGVKNSECVLIDDNENYCTIAGQENMKTILYHDFKQMKIELEIILAASQ